jgi:hypothetical protein
MKNSDMTENRYLIMYQNKKLYNGIISEIEGGAAIQVTTYTQSRIYTKASQFRLGKTGVYVQRGKHWDCINFCSIRPVR